MKTRSIKKDELKEKWYIVDATGIRLGKLATKVAALLIGKNDVDNVSYHSSKNKVIVLNSKDVDIHPRKVIGKKYYWHSGFPGGLKELEYGEMKKRKPLYIVQQAVSGMLPKTKQRAVMLTNLYLYEGTEHKHEAQKPLEVKID